MKKNIKYLLIFCFFAFFLSISIIGSTFAKYVSSGSSENSAVVAVMANDITTDLSVAIEGYPGSEPTIIPITLINKENNKVCEVDQKFTLSINADKSTSNLPLDYELYSDEATTDLLTPNGDGIYESNDFVFKANKEEKKVYYLKISWPINENDASLAFEIDYLTLNIKLNQI